MTTGAEKEPFVIELEANATDSLSHGVEHFLDNEREYDFKYAVLHIFHSIELFFKARLAREHSTLIYEKPEKTGADHRTVNFDTLIARLKSCGVMLEEQAVGSLFELRKIRNRIEHHRVITTKEEVENYIGASIKILDTFLLDELDINLRETLDESLYEALEDAVYSYTDRIKRAANLILNTLGEQTSVSSCHTVTQHYSLYYCEDCGEQMVPVPDRSLNEPESCKCYFCESEYYYEFCGRCDLPIFKNEPNTQDNQHGICNDCLEDLCSKD